MKKIEFGKTVTPKFTILIVDDVPKNLQYLGSTLKNENYNFEFATNGIKALEWIKKKNFDLILLDIMMPEMDGFKACEEIRKNKNYKDVPIIFLTAYTDQKNILKGFELGAQDYITKPFNTKELLARVKTHLELKASKEKLKSINQWLEERVKEKTMQLNKSNEELKKANEALLSLEKAKAEFLNLMSHEIRTPLNGIIGPVQLLKDKLEHGDLASLVNILDISVARLEKFSYTAMKITELRTKQHKFNLKDLKLKILCGEVKKMIADKLTQKNLQLIIDEIPDDLTVHCEIELLKLAFTNILDNAIKYSEKNGKIFIKIQHTNTQVSCRFIDQGKGFSKKALESLYRFFSPGDEYVDETLGLDLALVKLIMDVHSGKIEVSNAESWGACVTLTLYRNA